MPKRPTPARPPLDRAALSALPLGAIKPRGWLRDQLRLQATGSPGTCGEVWPDVGPNSGWLGGDGEDWERGPYYCDGLVPLAHLLDDPAAAGTAERWIEWALASQRADGFFGPRTNDDWWPRMVMLKALTQHAEATGDERVEPFMERYFAHLGRELPPARWRSGARRAAPRTSWRALALQPDRRPGAARAGALTSQTLDWGRHFVEFPCRERHDRVRPPDPRRERGDGDEGAGAALAADGEERHRERSAPGWRTSTATTARPRHVLGRRVAGRARSESGRRAVRGRRADVLARAPGADLRRRRAGRPARADGVQRAAGDDHRRHGGAPVRPAAEPGALLGREAQLDREQGRLEHLRPRAELRLLHRQPAPGLAEVRRVDLARDAGRRPGRRGVRPVHGLRRADGPLGDSRLAFDRGRDRLSVRRRDPLRPNSAPGRMHAAPAGPRLVRRGHLRRRTVDRQPIARRLSPAPILGDGDLVELSLPTRLPLDQPPRGAVSVSYGPLLFALRVGEDWRKVGREEPFADWEVHPTTPWNYALDRADPSSRAEPYRPVPFDGDRPPLLFAPSGGACRPGRSPTTRPVPCPRARSPGHPARSDRADPLRLRPPARSGAPGLDRGLSGVTPPPQGRSPVLSGGPRQRRRDAPGRLGRVDDRGQRAGPARQPAGPGSVGASAARRARPGAAGGATTSPRAGRPPRSTCARAQPTRPPSPLASASSRPTVARA